MVCSYTDLTTVTMLNLTLYYMVCSYNTHTYTHTYIFVALSKREGERERERRVREIIFDILEGTFFELLRIYMVLSSILYNFF